MLRLTFASLVVVVTAAPSLAAADPIETCRIQSATSEARIACLEAAIRAIGDGGAPQTTAAAPAARNATPQGLGAEQIVARNPQARAEKIESEAVASPVARLEYNLTGRPIFHLENGQVWRGLEPETATRRLSAARRYEATVTSGTLGGYRLRLEGIKRLYAVERLQ
jgi:hypothetical protein